MAQERKKVVLYELNADVGGEAVRVVARHLTIAVSSTAGTTRLELDR